MSYRYRGFSVLLAVVFLFSAAVVFAGTPQRGALPAPSIDPGDMTTPNLATGDVGPRDDYGRRGPDLPGLQLGPPLMGSVECFNFDSSIPGTGGFIFIPPDTYDAVGAEHVINIGNVMIEWRRKDNPVQENLQTLQSFFSSLPAYPAAGSTLGTFTFDPKVIYDQYSGRFIVITLERWFQSLGDPADESRILVAVSKTSDPNNGWWFHSIDSKVTLPGPSVSWADYPGLAIDDKAIYITMNYFEFPGQPNAFGERLWIVDKAWYNGPDNSAVTGVHNAYTGGVAGFETTTMPAHMWGPPGIGADGRARGTFLVSYSGLTFGGPAQPEALIVIEVTDPLGGVGGPFFAGQFVTTGDLEDVGGAFGFPALPDAPQLGSTRLIEVNDRRLLDAVWRDNCLYATTTINPNVANDPANAGQTTAHWYQLDTTNPAVVGLIQEGNVGGEGLGMGTYTFFPSIAVDCEKNVAIGFSASNAAIYCGAYYASRFAADPPGSTGPACVLALGTDWYVRTFSTNPAARNRWGDYSGMALCPVDEATFYVYNQYACTRGTPTGTEDGRWCTRLGWFQLKGTVAVAISFFDASAYSDRVELRGEFASDIGVERVNVYRGTGDDGPLVQIANVRPDNPEAFSYKDETVLPGRSYRYQIGVVDRDGEFMSEPVTVNVPGGKYALGQNAPNPFNPTTTIRFSLPSSQAVSLAIYDASGRLVKDLVDGVAVAGANEITWDGTNNNGAKVSSGVYYYKLAAGTFAETRKMVLLK